MTAVAGSVLAPTGIVTGAIDATQADAIERVGGLLVAEGLVTPGYVAAMHAREAIVSTYLGNGIALPHGTTEAQGEIRRTGMAVVQYPAGVPWGEEPAHLVIGIAATSDEHIGILSRLAAILEDEAQCARLAQCTDPLEIHRTLTAPPPPAVLDDDEPDAHELVRTTVISNPSGLHARPAAQVVASIQRLDAEVRIETGERRADARSITALLGLGASVGDAVTVAARGPDAQRAMDAVMEIVESGRDR